MNHGIQFRKTHADIDTAVTPSESVSQLAPLAFDIETSGLDDDAVITVAGFSHSLGESLILKTSPELKHYWSRPTM